MSNVINTNLFSIYAQRKSSSVERLEQQVMDRLSSGSRVLDAQDDPMGLARIRHQEAQISGHDQAIRNTSDGVSMVQVADGVMGGITEVVQRMRELTIQARSGAISDNERGYLQQEFSLLQDEVLGFIRNTEFNNIPVINRPEDQVETSIPLQIGGEFSSLVELPSYTGYPFDATQQGFFAGDSLSSQPTGGTEITLPESADRQFKITVDGVESSVMTADFATRTADEWAATLQQQINEDSNLSAAGKSVAVRYDEGKSRFAILSNSEGEGSTITMIADMGPLGIKNSPVGSEGWSNVVTLEGVPEEERTITVDVDNRPLNTVTLEPSILPMGEILNKMKLQIPGLQAGYNEAGDRVVLSSTTGEQGTISVMGHIPKLGIRVHDTNQVRLNHYDLDDPEQPLGILLDKSLSIGTMADSEGMLGRIDGAIRYVSESRSHLASIERQLTGVAEGLELYKGYGEEARSRLHDTDFAKESAEMSRVEILKQVATAMMAQANQIPQQMLQLFR